jgi:hypothetical protein
VVFDCLYNKRNPVQIILSKHQGAILFAKPMFEKDGDKHDFSRHLS